MTFYPIALIKGNQLLLTEASSCQSPKLQMKKNWQNKLLIFICFIRIMQFCARLFCLRGLSLYTWKLGLRTKAKVRRRWRKNRTVLLSLCHNQTLADWWPFLWQKSNSYKLLLCSRIECYYCLSYILINVIMD